MYLDLLRERILPYRFFDKIKAPLKIVDFTQGYSSFDAVELYEEIQEEMKKNSIDISVYDKCISFAVSPSYVEDGVFKFLINKKPIEANDIKIMMVAGYIYIFHKSGFTITSILLLLKSNSSILDYNNTNNAVPSFTGKDITLNIRSSIFPELATRIPGNYIRLNPGEDIFKVLEINGVTSWEEYIFHMSVNDIIIYNPNTGFVEDLSDLEVSPLYIKNKSTDNIVLLMVDVSVDDWNTGTFVGERFFLYHHLNMALKIPPVRDFFKANMDKWVPREIVDYRDDFPNDRELLMRMRDFNYDMYISLMMERFRTNYLFEADEIVYTDKLETLVNAVRSKGEYMSPDATYLTVTFHNHRKLLPEVYFSGVRYNDYKIVEKYGEMTTIAIRADKFMEYYNLSSRADITHIYIVLRREEFEEYHYHNIFTGYNGVIPVGESFFHLIDPIIYDNGYRMKSDDITFNNLLPYGLLVGFPRRKFKNHQLVATGYRNLNCIKKELKLKVRNFDATEEALIQTVTPPDKYIYKSIFFTDYIDYRYRIYVGPYLLMMDVDYYILAPNIIVFNNTLFRYKEDLADDYMRITICLDEEVEIHQELAEKSSYLYKLFNDPAFRQVMFAVAQDTPTATARFNLDCPARYDDSVYRNHIFLTKYLSTEVTLDGSDTAYGKAWATMIEEEFPEMVHKDGTDILIKGDILDTTRNWQPEDFPRIVTLPEDRPLNIMVAQDIIAKRKLLALNMDNPMNNRNNEMNDRYFSKDYYKSGIDMNFVKADVRYLDTIPFDAIYDRSSFLTEDISNIDPTKSPFNIYIRNK